MRTTSVWRGLAASAALAQCAGPAKQSPPQEEQLVRAVSPPARLMPAAPLPGLARDILAQRMATHARDMGTLMSAIMVLDYEGTRLGAEKIAGDASLSRPLSQDATELNSALPEGFFVHQDELRASAGLLAKAAARLDARSVADAYGRLSESCVRCHAVYREGRAP